MSIEHKLLEGLEADLEQVERCLAQELPPEQLAPLKLTVLERLFHPWLLLASARAGGDPNRLHAVPLACVVQLIYLAVRLHRAPQDQDHSALPILVGDYLFTLYFAYLSRYEALEYLAPLATVITDINEADVQRPIAVEQSPVYWLEQGDARLAAEACRIGALVGGGTQEEVSWFAGFGRQMGVALGLIQRGIPLPEAVTNTLGAYRRQLAQGARTGNALLQLVDTILRSEQKSRIMVG